MYVSGKLKDKTIEFYKPRITEITEGGFLANKAFIGYDGSLIDKSKELKLIPKQEYYLKKENDKTNFLITKNFREIRTETNKIIKKIMDTNRKFTYALFECFYELVLSSKNTDELLSKYLEFLDFIDYVELENPNQIDLDILIKLYLYSTSYDRKTLNQAKLKKFCLKSEDIPTSSLEKIITFGEFVSPTRVAKVASTLKEDIERSNLILPTYFAIPDEATANKFLNSCRNEFLDEEQIKKNAARLRIPNNIQNLIR